MAAEPRGSAWFSSRCSENPGVPAPGFLVFMFSCLVHHAVVIRGADAISPLGQACRSGRAAGAAARLAGWPVQDERRPGHRLGEVGLHPAGVLGHPLRPFIGRNPGEVPAKAARARRSGCRA